MNFSLTQLKYLLAVDRTRQFSLAAKECHISQPTLSHQIQKIEEELGIVIFDRSKKPILNTELGQKIIDQAKTIILEANRLQEIVDESGQTVRGVLRIGIIPTVSPFLIPYFLNNFLKNYPEVELKVQENTTEEIIDLLIKDKLDGGILATPLHDDRIVENYLYNEPLYIYASEKHQLFNKKHLSNKQMTPEGLWIMSDGHCLRNQVLNLCEIDLRKIKFESGSVETIIRLVDRLGGYTVIPKMAVMELTKKQQSRVREFHSPMPTREISLVYSRIHYKEILLEKLSEAVVESLPNDIISFKKKVNIIEIN